MAARLSDLVRLDTTGWEPRPARDDRLVWGFRDGGSIGIFFFPVPPDIPPAQSIAELRRLERERLNAEGTGLIEYTVEELSSGVRAIRSVTKAAADPSIPLERSGLMFTGWLTIPFERLSIVVKAQAREVGPAGVREAQVLNKAMTEDRVSVAGGDQIQGWIPEPSDGLGPLDANLADLPGFDADFADHPLTKVRAGLKRVEDTMKIADSILRETPFPLPTG